MVRLVVVLERDSEHLVCESIRQSLTAWFEKNQLSSIKFLENLTPANDQYADYRICYEAVFEPSSLDQARVELWVSDKGYVSIGFESRERVAKRLSVPNRKDGFAAGYEPLPIPIEGLLANLEKIANGEVALSVLVLPWFGLGRTKAVMLDGAFRDLHEQDENIKFWLHPVQRFQSNSVVRTLRFSPWH